MIEIGLQLMKNYIYVPQNTAVTLQYIHPHNQ